MTFPLVTLAVLCADWWPSEVVPQMGKCPFCRGQRGTGEIQKPVTIGRFAAGRSQFWLHVENYFFNLLFIAVVIIIVHAGLPQRTLPLCLTIKLKCLCSAHSEIFRPCPFVSCYKKGDINPPLLKAGPSGDVVQDWRSFLLFLPTASPSVFCLLTLVPHCFSLWFYKRTWNPDPQKMVTLRHKSAIFPANWLSE